jgi:glycosyltransferase involved in cell wall biosynthesis
MPATISTEMAPLPVSIFIIAHNEADRLPRVLEAVAGLSDDVVLIDSGSTDGTQASAAALGARVLHNDWQGYGLQKRFGEEQCRHDWLLNLDADEVMSPELVAEVRALFANGEPGADAYELRIAEVFPGEGQPHSWTYTLAPVRLYRKDKGRYSASPVHDRVDLQPGATVARLKGLILHFSVRSLGHQLAKLNSYTDQQADDLAARAVRVPVWRVFAEFPAAFFKAYVMRRHFVRGLYGFMTAMNFAFYRWLRIAKAVERQRMIKREGKRP